MRITFIQTGDFRAAAHRIAQTGEEVYHAQRHSMAIVERLAKECEHVSVICTSAKTPYAEKLDSGVMTYGLFMYSGRGKDMSGLSALLGETAPTHVILRLPDADILQACLDRGASVLPTLADTISSRAGWRRVIDRFRHRRLAKLLNQERVRYIGNHNIAASESLIRIGVRPEKIIPWDWPRPHKPGDYAPKIRSELNPLRLLFVGAVSETKGVGDILRALALLPEDLARLTVLGDGKIDEMTTLAKELGVSDRVTFRGRVPFSQVVPEMRESDVQIVFTRAHYAEGLPGVIYQGLAARLPLLVSPHSVFRHYFTDRVHVLFSKSFQPADLAEKIREIATDLTLYNALSLETENTFNMISLQTDWVKLVDCWLRDDENDRAWLAARTLDHLKASFPTPQPQQHS